MRLWPRRRPQVLPAEPAESDLIAYARAHVTSPGAHALLDEVERGQERRARQEITAAHAPCSTAENGTGARCTCSFDCANYWLRARGHKQENL